MELFARERLLSDRRHIFDRDGAKFAEVLNHGPSVPPGAARFDISVGDEELIVIAESRSSGVLEKASSARLLKGDEVLAEAEAESMVASRRLTFDACGREFLLESVAGWGLFEHLVLSEGSAPVGRVRAGFLKAHLVFPDDLPSWYGPFLYCLLLGIGPRRISN